MAEYKHKLAEIPPKTEHKQSGGHKYKLTFDPNAQDGKKWVWQLAFTRQYYYEGSSVSLLAADRAVIRKIKELTGK
jgi:hypothetical protein